MTDLTAERLTADDFPAIVSVFCDAFHDYPEMRFVVGPRAEGYAAALEQLISWFVQRRVSQQAPLFGVRDGQTLVAAATTTPPGEGPFPASVDDARERLWQALGDDARLRYEASARAWGAFAFPDPHHHLNMIGVRPAYAGRGLGRLLLNTVRDLAAANPASRGVSLTTELARNVDLYRHCGYEVIGHSHVSSTMETWGLFLRLRSEDDATP